MFDKLLREGHFLYSHIVTISSHAQSLHNIYGRRLYYCRPFDLKFSGETLEDGTWIQMAIFMKI
ncbi:hypothetical protein BLOT_007272 [Blomia tropicalis]|nr:hypothetical protein BLOT_007272 [Blomia tropicalis]